jgi:outer membrane protein OmpA-like peptidoglycan-associated protein/uncharacterized protein YegP (UPF0339 family)
MRFLITQDPTDRRFAFQLQSDNEEPYLAGGGFASVEACTEAIRRLIAALPEAGRVTVSGDRVTATDADGRLLAQSARLGNADAARRLAQAIAAGARGRSEYEVVISRTTEISRRRPAFLQATVGDPATFYRFERLSRSGRPGIEAFQNEEDGQFYFHLNDAAGRALLYSRGFNAASPRDKRLLAVLESAGIAQRYEVREEGGRFYFILKARNGTEIARSRTFASGNERADAIAALRAQAPALLREQSRPAKPRSSPGDTYVLDRPSTSGQAGFESFRNAETKAHYFHFNDAAGQALLYSQGYRSGASRDNGIASIVRNAGDRAAYQVKRDGDRYYVVVLAANRQQIARSRWYTSEAEAESLVRFFITTLPGYAQILGIAPPPERRTVTETERLTLAAPPVPASDDTLPATRPLPPPAPDAPPRPHAQPMVRPAAEPEPSSRGGMRLWLPWILPLLAILLLLFLLRGCPWWSGNLNRGMAAEPAVESDLPPAADAETPPADTVALAPPAEPPVDPPVEAPPVPTGLGPNAAALQLDPDDLGGRLADFLSGADRSLPRLFLLDAIRFGYNAAEINRAGQTQLAELAKVLVAYPDIRLTIHGHADRAETDRQILSETRAKAVFDALVTSGVDAARLATQGFGANDPIAKGTDAESRQQNRRVTVVVDEPVSAKLE